MLEKKIRYHLTEAKERKERKLIEEYLIKNRLSMVLGNVKSFGEFNKLSEDKKLKLSVKFLQELSFLSENNLLVEQNLNSVLNSIYGKSFGNISETVFEPFLEKILSSLEFNQGYMRNFLITYLTSRQTEIIESFNDCKLLANFIAGGIVEGIAKTSQENKGYSGVGYDIIKNSMGGLVHNIEFVDDISKKIEAIICSLLSKITRNAQSVAEKLKPSVR